MASIQQFYMSMLLSIVADSISISPTTAYNKPTIAGSVTVNITASGPWTLTVANGILSPSATSGSGNGSITVSWSSNGTKFCRYDSITFTCGTASALFDWTQIGTFQTDCVA